MADHLLVAEQAASGTVRIWRDFVHRGGPTPAELHHVEEVLELLGLAELAGRPVDTLDLGHARLVELGRAMMGTPRLLMLDEPSSGLDAEDTARLSRILGETRRSTGVAVVLVEHDLALVESAVDRLVRPELRQGAGLRRRRRRPGRSRGAPRLSREHGVTADHSPAAPVAGRGGRAPPGAPRAWARPTDPTRRCSACR